MVFHRRCLWFWAQNRKRRLWKTINAPLCEGGVYGFGVCVYVFEGGWFCPLSHAVWGWLGCVWVEGGWGCVVLPFPGESWGLSF